MMLWPSRRTFSKNPFCTFTTNSATSSTECCDFTCNKSSKTTKVNQFIIEVKHSPKPNPFATPNLATFPKACSKLFIDLRSKSYQERHLPLHIRLRTFWWILCIKKYRQSMKQECQRKANLPPFLPNFFPKAPPAAPALSPPAFLIPPIPSRTDWSHHLPLDYIYTTYQQHLQRLLLFWRLLCWNKEHSSQNSILGHNQESSYSPPALKPAFPTAPFLMPPTAPPAWSFIKH